METQTLPGMNILLMGSLFSASLLIGILLAMLVGRRIGLRRMAEEGETASKGFTSVEGAVFGLLGLILAFLFSGALSRFDARRHLVVEEANAIGTAWLRVDLLPADAQPVMRDLFRRYTDSRIKTYELLPDMDAVEKELQRCVELQDKIWKLAVSSSQATGTGQAPMLVLPALNAMIDITTTRTEAAREHPPMVIIAMLGVLTLSSGLFAGYDMACRKKWNTFHSFLFAAVMSVTIYVVIDLEYPRLGLITMTDSDEVLKTLRQSMDPR